MVGTLSLAHPPASVTARRDFQKAKSYSVVIVREGGRSSIPEMPMIEPVSRSVLDPRLRGDDSRVSRRRANA